MQSAHCLAHMTGNVPGFVPALAQLLAALNQNLAKQQASRGFSILEQDALAEMHRLIYGFPRDFYRLHRFRGSST
jgi:glutamate decarboxylase